MLERPHAMMIILATDAHNRTNCSSENFFTGQRVLFILASPEVIACLLTACCSGTSPNQGH